MMTMSRWFCISAETGISLHLLRIKERGRGQMKFEVSFPEFALRAGNGGGGRSEAFLSNGPRGELPVQIPLLFDQLRSQRS